MDTSMQERIAKVAYELYEKRGRQDGHQNEDWIEAERLVQAQIAREGNMKKAGDDGPAARKVAARKETPQGTRKKLARPAAKTALSRGRKISPEATLS